MEGEGMGCVGSTEITRWRSRKLPRPPDAIILPDDTYLLLQAVTEELDPDHTPLDLWVALERATRTEKHPLGSVLFTDGDARGVTYIARVVVYDFDSEPICRREAVLNGLREALSELARRGCETIGVFPLGTMRGGISEAEYFEALREVVARLGGESPRTVYLLQEGGAGSSET
jgi:hypothetical protein